MLLNGNTALVTGSGGTGCGRAIALRLAREGASVVVSDINGPGGEETARFIQTSGGRAVFRRADVRQESDVSDLLAFAAGEFGPLRVLVNNASAAFAHGHDMSRWLVTAETEFIGPLLTTRYAIEAMRNTGRGGAIVNVSSISALWHGRRTPPPLRFTTPPKPASSASPPALPTFGETDRIRVNCLAPGWIATDGPRQYWESLTPERRAAEGVPARLLTTDQIAEVVLQLATSDSLAGRVVLWWSDDEPKVIDWADRGYRTSEPFTLHFP